MIIEQFLIEGKNLLMILLKFLVCAIAIAVTDKYVWNKWSLQTELKRGNMAAALFAGLVILAAAILR